MVAQSSVVNAGAPDLRETPHARLIYVIGLPRSPHLSTQVGGGNVSSIHAPRVPSSLLVLCVPNSVRAECPRCPAAGHRRGRGVALADDAIAEVMPPPRRARDQPADEVDSEPFAAPANATSSTEATGEKTATPPSPAAYGSRMPAFLSYHFNMLCTRLPTPQVVQKR